MQKAEHWDKLFYMCSLCNNCKTGCPYGVDLKLQETREFVTKHGHATDAMKKVIENLKLTGNPYGITQ